MLRTGVEELIQTVGGMPLLNSFADFGLYFFLLLPALDIVVGAMVCGHQALEFGGEEGGVLHFLFRKRPWRCVSDEAPDWLVCAPPGSPTSRDRVSERKLSCSISPASAQDAGRVSPQGKGAPRRRLNHRGGIFLLLFCLVCTTRQVSPGPRPREHEPQRPEVIGAARRSKQTMDAHRPPTFCCLSLLRNWRQVTLPGVPAVQT